MSANKWLYLGVGLVGGAAVGSVASYFITKKSLTDKLDETLTKEMNMLHDHYSAKRAELKTEVEDEVFEEKMSKDVGLYKDLVDDLYSEDYPEEEGGVVEAPEKTQAELDEEHLREQKEVYEQRERERHTLKTLPVAQPREGEDDNRTPPPEYPNGVLPQVISFEEYWDDRENGKMDITYFEVDDIFIDEREEIIDDVESYLGTDFRNYFGWQSDDANTVYVRNPKHKNDYSVTRETMSYQEHMVGEQMADDQGS